MRFQSKNVIVTEGASGIGRSICSRFGSEGATVVIADIDDLEGHKTQERLSDSGCASIFVQADVSCEKDVTRLVYISENFMSGIDVVVNNAGAFEFGDIVKSSPEGWDKGFGINVIGATNLVRHSLGLLKQSSAAAVVNIASISSFVAQPDSLPYNTSKGALLQLTRCLAMDLGCHGIRVNCICPGDIGTDGWFKRGLTRQESIDPHKPTAFVNEASDAAILGRIGSPGEGWLQQLPF